MKSAVLTIFKKELKRFFSDRRLMFGTILLPGLMIFCLYNFMGSAINGFVGADEPDSIICAVDAPEFFDSMMETVGISVNNINENQLKEIKTSINDDSSYVACVVFPKDFTGKVAVYDSNSGQKAPNIEVYYNSASTASAMAFQSITTVLDGYESSMINKFDINNGSDTYDLASDKDVTSSIFSMMLPMLLMMFMYSGCMAVGVESIAGEKERGTIATLLVTPTKRSNIAIGKILALSVIALLSGASSTLGTISSLPKLMGTSGEGITGSVYGIKEYAVLALVILSTVLVLITLISIISAFAKTVKEAQTYVLPVMILVLLIGVSGMFGSSQTELYFYMIPLYNSVQSMISIFSFNVNYTNILITIITNIVCTGIGVFVLAKLFGNEKVMFSK